MREQIGASRDVLERIDVRAPDRGIVVRVNYHSRGAVVAPGAIILELLPVDDKLVIEGRVNPNDISHVHDGQDALVRLTALNQRLTPVINGQVVYVSADAIADQQAQQPASLVPFHHQSYIVRVKLDEDDVHKKIGDFNPTPGHARRRLHQDRRADVLRVHAATRPRQLLARFPRALTNRT